MASSWTNKSRHGPAKIKARHDAAVGNAFMGWDADKTGVQALNAVGGKVALGSTMSDERKSMHASVTVIDLLLCQAEDGDSVRRRSPHVNNLSIPDVRDRGTKRPPKRCHRSRSTPQSLRDLGRTSL